MAAAFSLSPSRRHPPCRRGLLLRSHCDTDTRRVEEWLETLWNKPVAAADLAAIARLSERQPVRRITAATGKTPIEYLQNLRVEQARHLLETTTSSVSDITWSDGYDDIKTFRKLFRRSVGLTPNRHR